MGMDGGGAGAGGAATLRLADLPPARRDWLGRCYFDSIIEKHEGPWKWGGYLLDHSEDHADFLSIEGRDVLLPIPANTHPAITPLRVAISADGDTLSLWLTDASLAEYYDRDDAWMWAGYFAVCERAPGAEWFVAILYHEVFLKDATTPLRLPPWP